MVEGVAWALGTQSRLRFALFSGAGVATIGLAAEWVWNQGANQPWRTSLLPDALILCILVGLGAAVVGAAFAATVARDPGRAKVPAPAVVVGGLAVLVALALPMTRGVGDVTADIELEEGSGDRVTVHVTLDPPDAAEDARWFQVINWQGGGLVIADMDEVGPGEYVADEPIRSRGEARRSFVSIVAGR